MKIIKSAIITIILFTVSLNNFAQEEYKPTEENLQSRKEFSDMKFGIFIHWGIYSMFGQGEWYLQNANLDYREYAKAADAFYPHNFDAKEWVSAIKDSGAKYITFTSRHHDSFSMFKTKMSDFNIVDATPYKKDVIGMLADECHKQGIRLHFYYSQLDWSREEYPIGNTGRGTKRDTSKANYPEYLKFMKGQLTELLTNYGKIGAIWFDGYWDHANDSIPFDWKLQEQYDLIHRLQPGCLIGNNHHENIKPGEDIQIFERDVPGENNAGYSGGQKVSKLPLETCTTMNGMWGYQITDQNYKSTKEIIHLLVKTSSQGANLLLNIGPQPNGKLPETALKRLHEIGIWLRANGESIYGTTAGDFQKCTWGESTRKGKNLYLHVLNNDAETITIPKSIKIKKVTLLNGQNVKYTKTKDSYCFNIGKGKDSDIDRIIKITE